MQRDQQQMGPADGASTKVFETYVSCPGLAGEGARPTQAPRRDPYLDPHPSSAYSF
jgi:hypothetical protein